MNAHANRVTALALLLGAGALLWWTQRQPAANAAKGKITVNGQDIPISQDPGSNINVTGSQISVTPALPAAYHEVLDKFGALYSSTVQTPEGQFEIKAARPWFAQIP